MQRHRSLLSTFALVATAGLALAGCGSSGGAKATTGTTAAAGTTATSAAATSAPVTAITIKDFDFAPKAAQVKVGQSITWTNQDDTKHNLRSDLDGFKSEDLAQGKTFSFTFTKAGTYTYTCGIHPQMEGTVTAS